MKCKKKIPFNTYYFGRFETNEEAIKEIFEDAIENFDGIHLDETNENAVLFHELYNQSLKNEPDLTWNEFKEQNMMLITDIIDDIGAIKDAYSADDLAREREKLETELEENQYAI